MENLVRKGWVSVLKKFPKLFILAEVAVSMILFGVWISNMNLNDNLAELRYYTEKSETGFSG